MTRYYLFICKQCGAWWSTRARQGMRRTVQRTPRHQHRKRQSG